jgi:hypothetical protein
MGFYLNINKQNEIVFNSENIVFSKKQLIDKFEKFIIVNGFKVKRWDNIQKSPYEITITDGKSDYFLVVFLKSLSLSGWENKPHIKRVQVPNIRKIDEKKYINTSMKQTLVILGYYEFDENPIMVAWNAYKFVFHNTLRSCYVNLTSLQTGYKLGYFECDDSKQKHWIFTSDNFEKFLKKYIEYNRICENYG